MVLPSWIIHYLKMNKISSKVIKVIEETMKNWRVTVGGKSLAEVKIQRAIYRCTKTVTICKSHDAVQSYT